MNRARAFLLAALGLALPAGLALAVYLTSAGPLAATPEVLAVSPQIGVPATTSTSAQEPTTTSRREDRRDEDLPGKCKDPDHRLDPDCDPGRDDDEDDDSSGRGRSGSDDDSSGPGGGGDDSSGSGSGGDDDSSGSGSDNSGSDDD